MFAIALALRVRDFHKKLFALIQISLRETNLHRQLCVLVEHGVLLGLPFHRRTSLLVQDVRIRTGEGKGPDGQGKDAKILEMHLV